MRCSACDVMLEDKKNPIIGKYPGLCPVCVSEIQRDLADMPEAPLEDTPRGSWDEFRALQEALDVHDWGEGLGLMPKATREAHMRHRASREFYRCRREGMSLQGALEFSLGTRKYRGNRQDIT